MVSEETINDIFSISRVEEVVGNFIDLKKSGSNYKGLSPFSNERTPSLIVSPSKQIWKDFSSGKGGNVISFIMEYEKFTYPEALRWLADKYNIVFKEINKKTNNTLNIVESIYIIQNFAKNFFINQLYNEKKHENIIFYLKNRGVTSDSIKKFEIGYAPENKFIFTNIALKKGFKIKNLEKSGLTIIKKNINIDRFNNRIIFPIKNISGKILGFGGRLITNTISNNPKYINSKENKFFHKRKNLYGLYESKQYISKENFCYLVEGYIDVISLYQKDIKNVISCLGTSLSIDQIKIIKRFTYNIILLYDGDESGIKASLRNVDLILLENMNVNIALLPNREDPDSISKKYSNEELIKFIKLNTINFVKFKYYLYNIKLFNILNEKLDTINSIISSISIIKNNIKRQLYIYKLSSLFKINEKYIYYELFNIDNKKNNWKNKKLIYDKTSIIDNINLYNNPLIIAEEKIIQLILIYGDKKIKVKNNYNEEKLYKTTIIEEILYQFDYDNLKFSCFLYQKIFNEVRLGLKNGEFRTSEFFIKSLNEYDVKTISSLIIDPYYLAKWSKKNIHVYSKEEKLSEYLKEVLLRYKIHYISSIIKKYLFKIKNNTLSNNINIRNKIMKLTELKIKINKNLNRYV